MSYCPQGHSSSIIKTYGQYCPLSKSCPYLGGEPARKVLNERNCFRKRVEEMEGLFVFAQKEIERLRNHITQLEQENNHLKEDLSQAHQAPFKKASSKRERQNGNEPPRKRGAAFGHPGASRKRPKTIDQIVGVPLERCPICDDPKISITNHLDDHIQQDIIIKKVITRCFVHFHYWCPTCKKIVSGYAQNELPKAPIGPVAKAIAAFLRYEIKVSYDDIQRIFHNLFGLEITPGAIVGFDNKIYQKALPLYNGLKSLLPHTSNIYADETGWKIDGETSWLWTFANEQLAFYHIDRHRSGDVIKEHLGAKYNGILSSDFYSAYNKAIEALAKQKCTTHLLRDVKELEEKFPNEPSVTSFCQTLKKLIQDALLLHSQHKELAPTDWKSYKEKLFGRFKKLIRIPVAHPEAETLRKRLLNHKKEILTFLNHPEIEPDNNRAERALRNSVLLRKITFGNRSPQGANNLSLITTIIRTAKLKGLSPKEVLQTLLTKGLTPELSKQFGLPRARSP